MPIAVFYLLFFVGLLVFSFGLNVALLRLGLRWVKAPNFAIRRVVLTLLLLLVVQTAVGLLLRQFFSTENPQVLIALLVGAIFNSVFIPCFLISKVFKIRLARSFRAYLPSLAFLVLALLVSRFVLRPYVVETYRMTGNSMAPTVLGFHRQGVCQECGELSFGTVIPGMPTQPGRSLMICQDQFHVTRSGKCDARILNPDRIIVAKFLKPERWDIVVFRSPADPTQCYCKRLVGLPGEDIEIRDGSVWANGSRLSPPDSIQSIRYVSETPGLSARMWGTANRPAKLAADEYFVLGDFSENAEDSRFWSRGAPGHHPYAVPRSHIIGVATHIVWPPRRWSTLR